MLLPIGNINRKVIELGGLGEGLKRKVSMLVLGVPVVVVVVITNFSTLFLSNSLPEYQNRLVSSVTQIRQRHSQRVLVYKAQRNSTGSRKRY